MLPRLAPARDSPLVWSGMERLADPFAVIALIIAVIATALLVLVLWDTWHYYRLPG